MDAPSGRRAAVVIGGAGGIGGAALHALVQDRPELVPWTTFHSDEGAPRALAERVPELRWRSCDVGRPGDLEALAAAVGASAASVAVLVHAALEPVSGTLLELGHEQVARAVATSGTSLLAAVEAFDHLLQPGSAILFVTSMGAHRVVPRYGAVASAKAAGEALVIYLASELAERGVRVNAISAGPVPTKAAAAMVGPANLSAAMSAAALASPRRRGLELAEVGEAARLLCGEAASGITGQTVVVDGGVFTELVLTPAQLQP